MIQNLFKKGVSFFKTWLTWKPRVYWWSVRNEHGYDRENFGDIITPYIVEALTGQYPFYISMRTRLPKFFKHSIMVGSIIASSKPNTIVWGSGIIKENEVINGGTFLAVRGPKTAKRLMELGFRAPEIYGDPALLLSKLYNRDNIEKSFKFGLISHYIDFDEMHSNLYPNDDVLHIDLRTNSVENVIDEILKCEKIISTSLHGIIVAHSYGIPAVWWKYSDKLSGDNIKFVDYYESIEISNFTDNNDKTLNEIIETNNFILPKVNVIKNIQDGLLKSFPYTIRNA